MRVNFVVPDGVNSFYYSAVFSAKWMDCSRTSVYITSRYMFNMVNVRINDMWDEFLRPKRADIYWLDTPLYYNDVYDSVPLQRLRPSTIIVTSSWNRDMCEQYFGRCEVLPRLIHPVWMVYRPIRYDEKEYDIGFVGNCWFRKNCEMFNDICRELGLRCWITGKYNRLSLYSLVELVRRTKFIWMVTMSEGFGLPTFESQAVGTLPICTRAHANIDWCYSGLWVEPVDERIVVHGKRYKLWIVDKNDVKSVIRDAPSGDEYDRIAGRARERTVFETLRAVRRLHEIIGVSI